MGNIGNGRPIRVCDLCGQVDDHPRDVIIGTEPGQDVTAVPSDEVIASVVAAAPPEHAARLLRELMDTNSSDRHLDCCAAAGCANCADRIKGAEGKAGADLLTHLVGA
jgi:hypothetical protein